MWNKRILTTEDANSIIEHFGKGFCDYYLLDTRELETVDTWFAYDFIDVTRVTDSISLNIKNSLWTGGYRILDCNIESPTVSVSGTAISVSGTGLEWVVLELELSPEFNHGSIFELDYEVEYTPVIRPFYGDIALTMGFISKSIVNGEIVETPVSGLSVTDMVTGDSLTTDSDGLVTVVSDIDKAGDYDYILEAENNGVTVDYYFPYKRVQAELPVRLLNDSIVRDKTNLLEFEFLFDDEYNITEEMLFENNHIRLKVDGKYYEINEYANNVFSFEVPISGAYKVNMQLEINGNDYLDNYVLDYSVGTVYATFDSASALKTELESDGSASTVVFNGSVLDASILISKDVRIIFSGVCTSSLDSVFTVTGGVFTISNANFTGKNFITINNGSVELVDSNFNHCTSTIIKGTGDLSMDTCSFVDNNACVDVSGTVQVKNSLFDLSDTDYLDNTLIPFLDVYGDLTFDYCQFCLDLHDLTSLGYSYVMLRIGGDYMTNGIENNRLLKNEQFKMLKNTSEINVESDDYHITGRNSKAITWNIVNTNTVFSNQLTVDYIGDD